MKAPKLLVLSDGNGVPDYVLDLQLLAAVGRVLATSAATLSGDEEAVTAAVLEALQGRDEIEVKFIVVKAVALLSRLVRCYVDDAPDPGAEIAVLRRAQASAGAHLAALVGGEIR